MRLDLKTSGGRTRRQTHADGFNSLRRSLFRAASAAVAEEAISLPQKDPFPRPRKSHVLTGTSWINPLFRCSRAGRRVLDGLSQTRPHQLLVSIPSLCWKRPLSRYDFETYASMTLENLQPVPSWHGVS
jgi:hypothetical protein